MFDFIKNLISGTNTIVQVQIEHFSIGCLFVFGFYSVFGLPLLGAGLALAYMSFKEFYLQRVMHKQPFATGLRDFGFLALGVGVALGVIFLVHGRI